MHYLDLLAPPPDHLRLDLTTAGRELEVASRARRQAVKRLGNIDPEDTQRVVKTIELLGGRPPRKSDGSLDLRWNTGLPALVAQGGRVGEWAEILRDEWSPAAWLCAALGPLIAHCRSRGVDTLAPTAGLAHTGRLILRNPPIHSLPGELRHLVTPADRCLRVVSADWSSAELRIAAAMAGENVILDAFRQNRDLLAETATQVGIDRSVAKQVVYGAILYGQGDAALAATLQVAPEEASSIKAAILSQWPALTDWLRRVERDAAANGFVTTISGRRVSLRRPGETGAPLYRATNYTVQGSGADLLVQAVARLRRAGLAPVLTWHDEIVLATDSVDEARAALVAAMTAAPRCLPDLEMAVDVAVGDTLAH